MNRARFCARLDAIFSLKLCSPGDVKPVTLATHLRRGHVVYVFDMNTGDSVLGALSQSV